MSISVRHLQDNSVHRICIVSEILSIDSMLHVLSACIKCITELYSLKFSHILFFFTYLHLHSNDLLFIHNFMYACSCMYAFHIVDIWIDYLLGVQYRFIHVFIIHKQEIGPYNTYSIYILNVPMETRYWPAINCFHHNGSQH